MLKNLMQPQEIEAFYIIPAIRAHLAKEMKNLGKNQKEIAKLLGLRESTVSQYINNKRATLEFNKNVLDKISKLAKKIKSQNDVIKAVQIALSYIKKSYDTCKLHKKVANSVPPDCKICFKVRK